MPKLTRDMESRIWEMYQKYLNYDDAARASGVKDPRTVKRLVLKRQGGLRAAQARMDLQKEESRAEEEAEARRTQTEAFKIFQAGRGMGEVAIELGLSAQQAVAYQSEWLLMGDRKDIIDVPMRRRLGKHPYHGSMLTFIDLTF